MDDVISVYYLSDIPAAVLRDSFCMSRNSPTVSGICGSKKVVIFHLDTGELFHTKFDKPSEINPIRPAYALMQYAFGRAFCLHDA